MSLPGMPIETGFYTVTQKPIEEAYLNDGVAWADEATAKAAIEVGMRYPYQMLIIGADLCWFLPDLSTIQKVKDTLAQLAADVPVADADGYFAGSNVETVLAEIGAALEARKNPYTIELPAGASIADRLAGAVTIPDGWAVSVDNTVNLLITHTFTSRKIASVNVYEIDGDNQRLNIPFQNAFSGVITNTANKTVTIEGLNPTALALRIELIFDL